VNIANARTAIQSGNVTFELWFNPTSNFTGGTYQSLMALSDTSSNNDLRVVLSGSAVNTCSAGTLALEMFTPASAERDTCSTQTSWTGGTWYHVVVTYSATTGVQMYVNGALAGSRAFTNRGTSLATEFWLGSSWDNKYFDGKLDEIRVSDTDRSSIWISTEYNNESSPSTFYALGSEETQADAKTNAELMRHGKWMCPTTSCTSNPGEQPFVF
jgi:hypothetical protein